MKKLTGGQAVVESLKAEGVSHVFGLIGIPIAFSLAFIASISYAALGRKNVR